MLTAPHIWDGYDRNKPLPKHVSQLLSSREDRRTEGKDKKKEEKELLSRSQDEAAADTGER